MWKVDIREVTFLGSEYNEEAYRIGNLTQYFRHRTMSLVGGDTNRRAYTTIGKKRDIDYCLRERRSMFSGFPFRL